MTTKYTKQLLEDAVKHSISIAGVLRFLNLRQAGGTHTHISKKIKEYIIDTSHFKGQGSNCGNNHKGGPKKKHWRKRLVKRSIKNKRQKSHILRRALIESGKKYECVKCGLNHMWNNKEIMLQVNHKNREWTDDRPSNLEFLCPNCHSQSDGWCGSKGLSSVTKRKKK